MQSINIQVESELTPTDGEAPLVAHFTSVLSSQQKKTVQICFCNFTVIHLNNPKTPESHLMSQYRNNIAENTCRFHIYNFLLQYKLDFIRLPQSLSR